MKRFFMFICILSCSMVLTYIIGSLLANSYDITGWTTNGHNYFIAGILAFTLFSTLILISREEAAEKAPKVIKKMPKGTHVTLPKTMSHVPKATKTLAPQKMHEEIL